MFRPEVKVECIFWSPKPKTALQKATLIKRDNVVQRPGPDTMAVPVSILDEIEGEDASSCPWGRGRSRHGEVFRCGRHSWAPCPCSQWLYASARARHRLWGRSRDTLDRTGLGTSRVELSQSCVVSDKNDRISSSCDGSATDVPPRYFLVFLLSRTHGTSELSLGQAQFFSPVLPLRIQFSPTNTPI